MPLRLASIVVKGNGFTPGAVTAPALQGVFQEDAQLRIVAPPLAVVAFPSGFEVMIQEDRIDVKKPSPDAQSYPRMQRSVRELLALWPLVEVGQLGINFELAENYENVPGSRDRLTERFMRPEDARALFGVELSGAVHALTFGLDDARVTVKISTDALLGERAAYSVDLNAHYDRVANLDEVLATQEVWLGRVTEWTERLTR
jgi:hypothetical protein